MYYCLEDTEHFYGPQRRSYLDAKHFQLKYHFCYSRAGVLSLIQGQCTVEAPFTDLVVSFSYWKTFCNCFVNAPRLMPSADWQSFPTCWEQLTTGPRYFLDHNLKKKQTNKLKKQAFTATEYIYQCEKIGHGDVEEVERNAQGACCEFL